MKDTINVFYKDRLVGEIAKLRNKYVFQYNDEWIENGFSISPFSLPLAKGVFTPNDNNFDGLFGVFADSLPDAWGRLLLERYLRSKGIIDYDSLYRLAIIGSSGMGALEYRPNIKNNLKEMIDFDDYQKEADAIIDDSNDVNIDLLYKYGGSSGGARPKALIKYNGEDWIVKFRYKHDRSDIGICEYDYAKACLEAGINMPNFKLFPSHITSGYFAVKRFDRDNGKKIHMISASALLEADYRVPCCDYVDLFRLTKIITKGNKADLEQLFLRMCFNVYAHNLDDHLKNFSYLYDEETKTYRLSPAYDMVYSDTYYNEHTTSVNKLGKSISDDDLLAVGIKAGLSKKYCEEKKELIKSIVNNKLRKYLD